MARIYDALGRVTSETRSIAGRSYVTGYAYNAAGKLTSVTYPSGRVVSVLRNGVGQVTTVSMKPPGSAASTVLASNLRWNTMSSELAGLGFSDRIVSHVPC